MEISVATYPSRRLKPLQFSGYGDPEWIGNPICQRP
jgi:hypothetical protein